MGLSGVFFSQIFLVVVGEYKNAKLLDVEDPLQSIFLSSHFSRQCHLLVKSSNERAFNAFHVKITRNILGVKQIGFLAHGHKREHTPWGTVEFLIKKKELIGSGPL